LAQQALTGSNLLVQVDCGGGQFRELISIKVDGTWQAALSAASSVRVRTDAGMRVCPIKQAVSTEGGLLLTGDCGIGTFEQRVHLTPESDVLDVSTRLELKDGLSVRFVEDRYDFVSPRHATNDEHTVWSQNIKSEANDLIPNNSFKSPAVMMQQGSVFVALMPRVNDGHAETRALRCRATKAGERHPYGSYYGSRLWYVECAGDAARLGKRPVGAAIAKHPLHRRHEDPDFATQAHEDQMSALVKAARDVLLLAGIAGQDVTAMALDTTGSSVVVVDDKLQPLDECYLWCDHRAHLEAQEITLKAMP
jgi:hypothetical protein